MFFGVSYYIYILHVFNERFPRSLVTEMQVQLKTRVLIADMNCSLPHSLKHNLEALGFIVDVVSKIRSDNEQYSVIFLYVTASTSSLLLENFAQSSQRQRKSTIAVIESEGSFKNDIRNQCLAAGMSDILEEPWSLDALYECVCSLSACCKSSTGNNQQINCLKRSYLKMSGESEHYV